MDYYINKTRKTMHSRENDAKAGQKNLNMKNRKRNTESDELVEFPNELKILVSREPESNPIRTQLFRVSE